MNISIPVAALDTESIIAALETALQPFGCTVLRSETVRWERPRDFRLRVGKVHGKTVSDKHLCRRLEHPACPKHQAKRGPKERLTFIGTPCPDLERFVIENLK